MAPEGDVEGVCCDAPWLPIYYFSISKEGKIKIIYIYFSVITICYLIIAK